MAKVDAVTAVRRYGLGARPGDLEKIAADPRGYVLAALQRPETARIDGGDLQPSHVILAELQAAQKERRAERRAAMPAPSAAVTTPPPSPMPPAASGRTGLEASDIAKPGAIRREAFRDDATARLQRARTTDAPFLERLVMFWSGHFCVSIAKGQVRGVAGAFEREAIRPHVLGRFADMLRAVEQHPAMLIYLDNTQSTGPNSRAGLSRGKGLNENLARETLELHTLGVDGGYTQADVTNLARLITGWTVGGLEQERVEPGRFMFAPARAEPGAFTVLGKRYEGGVPRGGEACLADLARHPSTARHIASRMARHFVAAEPPPALVARLETTFRDTDGDLAALARALVSAPEAWVEEPRKVVPPYDYLVAVARGLDLEPPVADLVRIMGALGQPLWQPPSPAGWPDADDAWMAPAAIRERLRVAERAAREVDRLADARVVAETLLGPALSEPTRQAIARAESRDQGLEIFLMSPEFLRR